MLPAVERQLWLRTPLVHSLALSRRTALPIYLKLDALQSTGSFKVGSRFSCPTNRLVLTTRGPSPLIRTAELVFTATA